VTTFAALKTQLAALIADPDAKTFSTTDLGYFINAAIAEVSRIAPQRFQEDITLVDGTLDYRVRGGTGNLVANPSFDEGDETMFDSAYNSLNIATASDLTAGWNVLNDGTRVLFSRSAFRKTGLYVGVIYVPANTASRTLCQYIPVNPDTTYLMSGWHWKGSAGGESNVVRANSYDADLVLVGTDIIRHDTTAGTPQWMSGSYAVPADGTVAFVRIDCVGYSAGAHSSQQAYAFENISFLEASDANLVADNAVGDIELRRVEVWSNDTTPVSPVFLLAPGSAEYVNYSNTGWDFWNGVLSIPYRIFTSLDPSIHFLRVWGYAPFDQLTAPTQVTDLSGGLEQAVMAYCRIEALQRLSFERDLFTQWQTHAGNTDVTPAALMNALSLAREDWRRKSRALMVLREAP